MAAAGNRVKCGDVCCERLVVRKRVDKRVSDQFSDVIRSDASQQAMPPARARTSRRISRTRRTRRRIPRNSNSQAAQTSGHRSRDSPNPSLGVMVRRESQCEGVGEGEGGKCSSRIASSYSRNKAPRKQTENETKQNVYREGIKRNQKEKGIEEGRATVAHACVPVY